MTAEAHITLRLELTVTKQDELPARSSDVEIERWKATVGEEMVSRMEQVIADLLGGMAGYQVRARGALAGVPFQVGDDA